MLCPYCNSFIPDHCTHCTHCGKPIIEEKQYVSVQGFVCNEYFLEKCQDFSNNILKFAENNRDYQIDRETVFHQPFTQQFYGSHSFADNDRIWKYKFPELTVKFYEMPGGSGKIMVTIEDLIVGRILEEDQAHFREMIRMGGQTTGACTITGGPYKYARTLSHPPRGKNPIQFSYGTEDFSIVITINESVHFGTYL